MEMNETVTSFAVPTSSKAVSPIGEYSGDSCSEFSNFTNVNTKQQQTHVFESMNISEGATNSNFCQNSLSINETQGNTYNNTHFVSTGDHPPTLIQNGHFQNSTHDIITESDEDDKENSSQLPFTTFQSSENTNYLPDPDDQSVSLTTSVIPNHVQSTFAPESSNNDSHSRFSQDLDSADCESRESMAVSDMENAQHSDLRSELLAALSRRQTSTPDTDAISTATTESLDTEDITSRIESKRCGRRKKQEDDDEEVEGRNPLPYELKIGHRILKEFLIEANKSLTWPFLEAVDAERDGVEDYYEKVTNPMWFNRMKEKFVKRDYNNITEFVSDFRLMLENCYRYNGPDHAISKKAQRLETMLEQKLSLLSRELREKTSISGPTGKGIEEKQITGSRRRKVLVPHDSTALLQQLRIEQIERDKEARRMQIIERKQQHEAALKEVDDWEDSLMPEDVRAQMKAMWEIPQIGHFLFLCQGPLNIGEVMQFELERCFLMPKESSAMQRVMTSLLSTPYQRTRLHRKPFMPYKVWESKLRMRVRHFYKVLKDTGLDIVKASQKLGLDEKFFRVVGIKNPLEKKKYHELSFYQKVWLMKGLCDYSLEIHESLREAIEAQPQTEQRDYVLGSDAQGNSYLHFPQFCGADVRIYRQSPIEMPTIDIPKLTPKQKSSKKKSSGKKKKTSTKKGKEPAESPVQRTRHSRLRQNPRQIQTYAELDEPTEESSELNEDTVTEADSGISGSEIDEDDHTPAKSQKLARKSARGIKKSSSSSAIIPRKDDRRSPSADITPVSSPWGRVTRSAWKRCIEDTTPTNSRASTPSVASSTRKQSRTTTPVEEKYDDNTPDITPASTPTPIERKKSGRGRKTGSRSRSRKGSKRSAKKIIEQDSEESNLNMEESNLKIDESNLNMDESSNNLEEGSLISDLSTLEKTQNENDDQEQDISDGCVEDKNLFPEEMEGNDEDDNTSKSNSNTPNDNCDNCSNTLELKDCDKNSSDKKSNDVEANCDQSVDDFDKKTSDHVFGNKSDSEGEINDLNLEKKEESVIQKNTEEETPKSENGETSVETNNESLISRQISSGFSTTEISGGKEYSGSCENVKSEIEQQIGDDVESSHHSTTLNNDNKMNFNKEGSDNFEGGPANEKDSVIYSDCDVKPECINSEDSSQHLSSVVESNIKISNTFHAESSDSIARDIEKTESGKSEFSIDDIKTESGDIEKETSIRVGSETIASNNSEKEQVKEEADFVAEVQRKTDDLCNSIKKEKQQETIMDEIELEKSIQKNQDKTETIDEIKQEKSEDHVSSEDAGDIKSMDIVSSGEKPQDGSGVNDVEAEIIEKSEIIEEPVEEEIDVEPEILYPDLDEFEMVVENVDDLRKLSEQFEEPPPTIVGSGKREKVIPGTPRKRCEKDLHSRLLFLLKELEPWESKLLSANRKTKLKLKKEQENYVEEPDKMEVIDVWESEPEPSSDENDNASNSEEEYRIEHDRQETRMQTRAGGKRDKKKPVEVSEDSQDTYMESTEEYGVSLKGRIRKRRVIPNNIEDQSLQPKKSKSIGKDQKKGNNNTSALQVGKDSKNISQQNSNRVPASMRHLTFNKSPTPGNIGNLSQVPGQQQTLVLKANVPGLPGIGQGQQYIQIPAGSLALKNPALLNQLLANKGLATSQPIILQGSSQQTQKLIQNLMAQKRAAASVQGGTTSVTSSSTSVAFQPFQFKSTVQTTATVMKTLSQVINTSPQSNINVTTVTSVGHGVQPRLGSVIQQPLTSQTGVISSPNVLSANTLSTPSHSGLSPQKMVHVMTPAGIRAVPLEQLPPQLVSQFLKVQQQQTQATKSVQQQVAVTNVMLSTAGGISTSSVSSSSNVAHLAIMKNDGNESNIGGIPHLSLNPNNSGVSLGNSPLKNNPQQIVPQVSIADGSQKQIVEIKLPSGHMNIERPKYAGNITVKELLEKQQNVEQVPNATVTQNQINTEFCEQNVFSSPIKTPVHENVIPSLVSNNPSLNVGNPTLSIGQMSPSASSIKIVQSFSSVQNNVPSTTTTTVHSSPQNISSSQQLLLSPVQQSISDNRLPFTTAQVEVGAVASNTTNILQQSIQLSPEGDRLALGNKKMAKIAVLTKTPHGNKQVAVVDAAKLQQLIAKKQAIDNAVKQVITEAPTTSLPTANIKVTSPFSMPSRQPHRPCTITTSAMKHPIAVPQESGNNINQAQKNIASSIQPAVGTSSTNIKMVSANSVVGIPSSAVRVISTESLAVGKLQSGPCFQSTTTSPSSDGAVRLITGQQSALGLKMPVVTTGSSQTFKPNLVLTRQVINTPQGLVQGMALPAGVALPQGVLQKTKDGQLVLVQQGGKPRPGLQIVRPQSIQGQNIVSQQIQGQNVIVQQGQGQNVIAQPVQGQNVLAQQVQGHNVITQVQGQNIIAQVQGQNVIAQQPLVQSAVAQQLQGQNVSAQQIQGQNIITQQIQGLSDQVQGQNILTQHVQQGQTSVPSSTLKLQGTAPILQQQQIKSLNLPTSSVQSISLSVDQNKAVFSNAANVTGVTVANLSLTTAAVPSASVSFNPAISSPNSSQNVEAINISKPLLRTIQPKQIQQVAQTQVLGGNVMTLQQQGLTLQGLALQQPMLVQPQAPNQPRLMLLNVNGQLVAQPVAVAQVGGGNITLASGASGSGNIQMSQINNVQTNSAAVQVATGQSVSQPSIALTQVSTNQQVALLGSQIAAQQLATQEQQQQAHQNLLNTGNIQTQQQQNLRLNLVQPVQVNQRGQLAYVGGATGQVVGGAAAQTIVGSPAGHIMGSASGQLMSGVAGQGGGQTLSHTTGQLAGSAAGQIVGLSGGHAIMVPQNLGVTVGQIPQTTNVQGGLVLGNNQIVQGLATQQLVQNVGHLSQVSSSQTSNT